MCRIRAQNTRLSMIKCWLYGIMINFFGRQNTQNVHILCSFWRKIQHCITTKPKTIGIKYIDHLFGRCSTIEKTAHRIIIIFCATCTHTTSQKEKSIFFLCTIVTLHVSTLNTGSGELVWIDMNAIITKTRPIAQTDKLTGWYFKGKTNNSFMLMQPLNSLWCVN